jgi:diguanylate cyclase (GGDEF)-like protein
MNERTNDDRWRALLQQAFAQQGRQLQERHPDWQPTPQCPPLPLFLRCHRDGDWEQRYQEHFARGCLYCRRQQEIAARLEAQLAAGALDPDAEPQVDAEELDEAPAASARCSLLVVDDNPYVLSSLAALLEREAPELDVITADSAEAGREVFNRREVDIILADQKMPRMTGVQLLEWVRHYSPRTVRLLMTGFPEVQYAVDAINRGQVRYYFLKPWSTENLLQVLREVADEILPERSCSQLLRKPDCSVPELKELVARLNRRAAEAEHLNRQRTRELEMLRKTDPLTELLNRRAIDDVVQEEVRRRLRYDRSPLALGLIDVDNLRAINERYHEHGGNQVLIALARLLRSSLRSLDTVGRFAGEEFLVLAPETNLKGAQVMAERIRSRVEGSPVSYRDELIPVTVSIGFAVAEAGVKADPDLMKHLAAAALGEAKKRGGNCVVAQSVPDMGSAARPALG